MSASILNGSSLTDGLCDSPTEHTRPGGHNDCAIQCSNAANTPIAIVGMALRLPGGVRSSSEFWDMMVNKRDGRTTIPETRYNIEGFHNSFPNKPGSINTQHGYFLQDKLEHLDATFFSMNRAEVEKLDPQQRLLLEVVWESMENGGQRDWRGKDIGCYVGVFGEDWMDLCTKDTQHLGMYRVTGSGDFAISNRVSYEYNLKGPSMTLRTGCSSALFGLHEACQALYNGDCSSAIVAGTNLIITPTMTIAMTEQGVLSPTGSCKTFDAAADGYARGEAINAIYIKRLDDAIRDGDPIRAVIRSTAINCDGKTPGMACPSSESQEQLIRRAYKAAQIREIGTTAYFECHGTGTAVGDPLETAAIANIVDRTGTYIGSVKPNVGHSEGAAGITSLIKAVLSLEHKMIPPNINFSTPNPKIAFERAKLKVPLVPTRWPDNRPQRVSVNSFGIGGANAHVVLDSAASFINFDNSAKDVVCSRPNLLVFSGNNVDSLRRNVTNIQGYVTLYPGKTTDVAHTLGLRRDHLTHRAFAVACKDSELAMSSFQKVRSHTPCLAFVFTGQSSQWQGMGVQLMQCFKSFRQDINKMDKVLSGLEPLCTAIQIGLVNLLWKWGIRPSKVVGHSSGEIAAAYASNAITAEAAIIIAYHRGQVTKLQERSGSMAAIGLGRDEVVKFLTEGVTIACENSPQSVTLSGDTDKIIDILASIKENSPDTFGRLLRVEMAYHSHHMKKLGEPYESLISPHVDSVAPHVAFYSSVSGELISTAGELGPSYWRRNMEQPVLFSAAVSMMLSQEKMSGETLFVEIGPHSTLAGPLRQIFRSRKALSDLVYVPTLVRNRNQVVDVMTAAGILYQNGVNIDFAAINGPGEVLTDLPTYSWQHDVTYWSESRVTRNWRLRKFPHHELLGSRMLESADIEPAWRNILRLEDVPWLVDHKIIEDVVFPCAGYIAMAGEAIRQMTGYRGYTLKQLTVKAALVLKEQDSTELVTSIRQVRLTDSLGSEWYEFAVSSFNGSAWIKHCVGQARSTLNRAQQDKSTETFVRKIESANWYFAMKKMGLNYGPRFQGLQNISAHPKANKAAASLYDDRAMHESTYTMHPTIIDQSLQLFTVAVSGGITRKLGKLAVPASIGEIQVSDGGPNLSVEVHACVTTKGALQGGAFITSGDSVVLSLHEGVFSPLENELDGDQDTVAAAQLIWKPDIDFMQPKDLICRKGSNRENMLLLEKLGLMCMIETKQRLQSCNTGVGHLKKFGQWIDSQTARIAGGTLTVVPEAQTWVSTGVEERERHLNEIVAQVEVTEVASIGATLKRVLDNLGDIFAGKVEPLELLMENNGLTEIYSFCQDTWDCKAFFSLLGHAKPTLKILEIGAGTGGTTASVLEDMESADGVQLYSKYTFTDISAGFFVTAKERFKQYEGIEYSVLDITKELAEQGFEPESYDLVLATNVLHATPQLQATLQNVRKLLAPGGRLFLQELCPESHWISYIMGILPGWWLGEDDQRSDKPFVSPARWDQELRQAGFSGLEGAVVFDDDAPYQLNATMVATITPATVPEKKVTLLHGDEWTTEMRDIKQQFIQSGYAVDHCTLGQVIPNNQDVVALLDLQEPFFDQISGEALGAFQNYLSMAQMAGTLWVTRSCSLECDDPRYSLILGVARTVRSELSQSFATLEMDKLDAAACGALVEVYRKFQKRQKDDTFEPECEYVLLDGVVHTGRYHRVCAAEHLARVVKPHVPRELQIGKVGLLDTLFWAPSKIRDLKGDEVEVTMSCVGLNFRDVLVSMGIVDGTHQGLGFEGSGTISRVGPEVQSLCVGDRVLLCDGACFSTRIVTSSKLCARIPDQLSFEEAATMPCVYSTVIHALINVGRLVEGQSVLIHSACGGVGLAAIQICKMIGAKIFATVGNEEKMQYLIDTFRIPRHHIFDSRSSLFLADVMRETNGKGVDIVLNSLSGELLHASWQCVAKFGSMLELGKRDFIGHANLAMDVFQANRSFVGIDLADLFIEKPEAMHRLLEQCLTYYRQGSIEPISPTKVFDARTIGEAFRYMQKGQHMGKIVLRMPEDTETLGVVQQQKQLSLNPDASYLLVGGLGGIGRAVSNWMVENGARELIYLSRSAGERPADQAFFRELESQGCRAIAVAGSAANMIDVQRAVNASSKPISGVIQMSMVLRDRALFQLTHDDWIAVLQPKVDGTWNLHRQFESVELDFFVLFSSISGIVGQWGQANYSSANTFLDAFVRYRRSLNLAASVIDIGIMADVGYVSQNQAFLEQFRASGFHTLDEQDLLTALHIAINNSHPGRTHDDAVAELSQFAIGLRSTKPLDDPGNRTTWKRDIRMAMFRSMELTSHQNVSSTSADLKQFLSSVAANPTILDLPESLGVLTREIGRTIYSFMLRSEEDMDVSQSLTTIGVDSLVSIEIRNWWKRSLGLEISVLEIMTSGSIARLGEVAVERLRAKHLVLVV